MDLYVIRHGPAAEPDAGKYGDDGRRPLTARGKKRMERAAAGLRRLGAAVERIYTSPLLRALQTAAIIGRRLGVRPRAIVRSDLLLPAADVEELPAYLSRHARQGGVALVGHEPHLSRLLGRLLNSGAGTGAGVEMKKGAVARLRVEWTSADRPRATLVWLIPARVLRRI
jgi:phosphohistidine phosphatase